MKKSEFDDFAQNYDVVLGNTIPDSLIEENYFAEYKIALVASILKSSSMIPNRILDFGCGSGRSLPYLSKYFPNSTICGYDVSETSLEVAAKVSPSAELFSHWDDSQNCNYDLIFTANVFHHIPHSLHEQTLAQCREALNLMGNLFLFEHNPYNPITKWIFERCPFDNNAEMIKMNKIKKVMKITKFHLKNYGYTLFFPRQLSLLRPIEPFIKYIPIGAQYYVQVEK